MTELEDKIGGAREEAQFRLSGARVLGIGEEVDQEARDLGHEAKNDIDAHIMLCTERWNQQRVAMAALQKSLDDMTANMLGRVPAGIIALLMGLCGWLAARAFPLPGAH